MRPIHIDRVSRYFLLCASIVAVSMLYLLASDSLTDHEPSDQARIDNCNP